MRKAKTIGVILDILMILSIWFNYILLSFSDLSISHFEQTIAFLLTLIASDMIINKLGD